MKKLIPATAFILFLAAATFAQDWQSSANPYGLRKAEVSAEGKTPDGEAKTTLTIQCSSGKGAMISLIYSVFGADKMKRFHFDDFEGPDAVAQSKKLTTFKVQLENGGEVQEVTQVSGGYAESDIFAFEASAKIKVASNISRIVAAISPASKITVTVQDYRNPKTTIQTVFSGEGSTKALAEITKNCLPPKSPSRKTR
jgi:hypothetical protein